MLGKVGVGEDRFPDQYNLIDKGLARIPRATSNLSSRREPRASTNTSFVCASSFCSSKHDRGGARGAMISGEGRDEQVGSSWRPSIRRRLWRYLLRSHGTFWSGTRDPKFTRSLRAYRSARSTITESSRLKAVKRSGSEMLLSIP